MSFRLYVGNYPSNFTSKDIENLLRDFKGVTLDKMHKKGAKTFSFIECNDVHQAVSVIQNLNNRLVSGRNLKVRASDSSLQEYIDVILQEINDNENPDETPLPLLTRKKDSAHQKGESDNKHFQKSSCYSRLSQNNYEQKFKGDKNESPESKSHISAKPSHNTYQLTCKDDTLESFEEDSTKSSKSLSNPSRLRLSQNNYKKCKEYKDEMYGLYSGDSPESLQNSYRQKHKNDTRESFEKDSTTSSKSSCYSPKSSQNNYHQKFKEDKDESSENNSYISPKSLQNSYQQKHKNDTSESFEKDSTASLELSQNMYKQKSEINVDQLFNDNLQCYLKVLQNRSQQDFQANPNESFEKDLYSSVENNDNQSIHKGLYKDKSFENNSQRKSQNNYEKKYEEVADESFERNSYSASNYSQKYENRQLLSKKKYLSRNEGCGEHYENSACYSGNNYQRKYERNFEKNLHHYPNSSQFPQNKSGRYKNQYEEFPDDSYSSNPSQYDYAYEHNSYENDYVSPRNSSGRNLSRQNHKTEVTWVSVTNFPIGTSIASVYDLFSDYDPITVKMICNVPRRDKQLTEAHVCFKNKDTASDVILNFDNTMYNGRVILVNDVEDLTIINELLVVTDS